MSPTITDRPGKRVSASVAPIGTPRTKLTRVALSEMRNERATISQTSRSPLSRRRAAASSPRPRSSIRSRSSGCGGRYGLDATPVVSARGEEWFAKLLDPELADECLRRRLKQEGQERLAARGIDART